MYSISNIPYILIWLIQLSAFAQYNFFTEGRQMMVSKEFPGKAIMVANSSLSQLEYGMYRKWSGNMSHCNDHYVECERNQHRGLKFLTWAVSVSLARQAWYKEKAIMSRRTVNGGKLDQFCQIHAFYKNIFYKSIKAEICGVLRIF